MSEALSERPRTSISTNKHVEAHCRYPGVKHFSAGDLLRDAVKNGNTELEAIMKEGKLVPVEVTIKLLKDAMLVSEGSVFLIDGFPRAIDQADVFEKQVLGSYMATICPPPVNNILA